MKARLSPTLSRTVRMSDLVEGDMAVILGNASDCSMNMEGWIVQVVRDTKYQMIAVVIGKNDMFRDLSKNTLQVRRLVHGDVILIEE